MMQASSPTISGPPRQWPFISVIVPVRNEGPFIRRTVEQLLAQDYERSRYEVLVADGRSTDDTVAVVRALQKAHANLHLLDNPWRWSSAGRNCAIRAARGEVLVVVDGHCELEDSDYLKNLVSAFERSGADCIGRPQPLDATPAQPLQRAICLARSCLLGHHHESFVYSSAERFVLAKSVAVAYRRDVFERVGPFDESFDACEDVELNHRIDRAGLRCFFTPKARVHYHARASLRGLFQQMHRYGRGRMRLLRKHPETFTIPGFLPAAFVLWLVIGAAAATLVPAVLPLYASTLIAYALVVCATALGLCIRARTPALLARLLGVFATIHIGAGTGILYEGMAGVRGAATKSAAIAATGQPVRSVPFSSGVGKSRNTFFCARGNLDP
jgi:succinoglycan biosynthesis protein ExoA